MNTIQIFFVSKKFIHLGWKKLKLFPLIISFFIHWLYSQGILYPRYWNSSREEIIFKYWIENVIDIKSKKATLQFDSRIFPVSKWQFYNFDARFLHFVYNLLIILLVLVLPMHLRLYLCMYVFFCAYSFFHLLVDDIFFS